MNFDARKRIYRAIERELARSMSSAETGNLAAATKNSTFQCGPLGVTPSVELPRSQATAASRF
jgi:hypothetical protein